MRKAASADAGRTVEKSGVGLRFVRELEQGKPTLRLDKSQSDSQPVRGPRSEWY